MTFSKDEVAESLRIFKIRRDDLLHEDESAFGHHLKRFVDFCERDGLVRSVLDPLKARVEVDEDAWWDSLGPQNIPYPDDPDAELVLRNAILGSVASGVRKVTNFAISMKKFKLDESVDLFRVLVARPFADELTHRLGAAADMVPPEARDLQAVPLDRIPRDDEVKIFLSHKSIDKPLARRYYDALKELRLSPWLDEPDMPAGSNLERALLQGFDESCAAVFFITRNFADENYLATEVDYAIQQKCKKGKKFSIITLCYPDSAEVPGLLTPYLYRNVENDLQGFYELLRALPIEVGPMRWKAEVVDT